MPVTITISDTDNSYTWPVPPTVYGPITSLITTGDRYLLNGKMWNPPGYTCFRSLHHYAQTLQLDPLTTQLQSTILAEHRDGTRMTGSTFPLSPRILCQAKNLFDLAPGTGLGFLDGHAKLMNDSNIVPTYVLLADCWTQTVDECKAFVTSASNILSKHVCRVSLVNEWGNQWQPINPGDFPKPTGVLISRGSSGGGDYTHVLTDPSPWDWAEFHGVRDQNRDYLRDTIKVIRDFKSEGLTVPVEDSEPPKFKDNPSPIEFDSTQEAFDRAILSVVAAKAGLFHTASGLQSAALTELELDGWISWMRAFICRAL